MAEAVQQAVILAAGMGTRLRSEHSDTPKGFLKLGDLPIIEESVLRLRAAGVTRIVIVTGHLSEHYEALAARYPGLIELRHNADFAESGSMYSLWCARDLLDGGDDFLLLESDLVFEPRALEFLQAQSGSAILLSGPTGAGDEVYVATRNGVLLAMSKDRTALPVEPDGELVGITRIGADLWPVMRELAEQAFTESLKYDYETDCLVAAAQHCAIACPVISDLVWTEIDDPAHLSRARSTVYPQIPAISAAD